jgi:NAD(P)-dependent dehydrogenase (short-subunit alcohol dehydrogenase family)
MLRTTKHRRWIITGAGGGLGRALADTVVRHGGSVASLTRDPTALPLASAERERAFAVDLRSVASLESAFSAAHAWLGGADVVVNNAGYGLLGAVGEVSWQQIHDCLQVNQLAALRMTQLAVDVMREQRHGTVVQISSLSATDPAPGMAAYAAAKAAVEAYSASVAREVGPLGLRVIIVQAGGMRTSWAGSALVRAPERPEYASTVGTIRQVLAAADGAQPTDPVDAADQIVHEVADDDATDRLLRMPIGSDAQARIGDALDRRLQELTAFTRRTR